MNNTSTIIIFAGYNVLGIFHSKMQKTIRKMRGQDVYCDNI